LRVEFKRAPALRAIFFKEFEMSNEQSSTERSKLFAEIQQTESDLAAANVKLGEERKHYDPLSMTKPTDSARALAETVSRLGSRLKTLQDELVYLDKAEKYRRDVAEAPALAEKACKEAVVAERRAAELAEQAAKVRAKIAAIEAENSVLTERARADETIAAENYAKTVSSGTQKSEQQAGEALTRAQAAVAAVLARAESAGRVVVALMNQAEVLEEEAGDAQSEAQSQYQAANEAGVTVARARWDEAVENLVEAGARLVEVCSRASLETGLHKLFVPRFAPGQWPVGDDTLRKLAAETEGAAETVEEGA
jgi:predicted  nucleic acid-binding Zn-ribbon protein